MEQWMFTDKRRYPRLKVRIPILYWGKNGSSAAYYTQDISANGISLISNRPFKDFSRFEINIELPQKNGSVRLISCQSMAVRTDIIHASKGVYKVGLFITKITPADRRALAAFVNQKLKSRIW